MRITIDAPILSVSIREVVQGDFFRFANGKNTETIFVALEQRTENYNTYWIARNMNDGEMKKLYVNTRKERVVVIVEPIELRVRDRNGSPILGLVEDDETDLKPNG